MKKKTKLISNHNGVTFTFILLIIINHSLFINNCFSQWIQQKSIILSSNKVLPGDFELKQNYPNPFNSQTTIEFTIGEKDFYKIIIYDILGREVALLHNNLISKGKYKLTFRADDLSSRIYYYILLS